MSRIWLLRGTAATVFGVLAGAWAVGLAGVGGSALTEKDGIPAAPEDSVVPVIHQSIVMEKAKPRRTRDVSPSPDPTTEATPDATTPADDPTSEDPTSEPPTSTPPSSPPSQTPTSPHTPSTPPSPSDGECDDLGDLVDCALDPITGHP